MSKQFETLRQVQVTSVPTFRYATLADAERLAELAAISFHQAFDGSSKQENVDDYVNSAFNPEQLRVELTDPKSTYVLVEVEGESIGYLKLYEGEAPKCVSEPPAIELSRLYVRREFWAQKVGAALMQRALEEARQKGYQTIFLGVWEHNERAKAFYRKWGFQRVGDHIFQMGDDPQTDWWMARKL